jgi:hypothetical protein
VHTDTLDVGHQFGCLVWLVIAGEALDCKHPGGYSTLNGANWGGIRGTSGATFSLKDAAWR